jgi:membrane protein required for colicin V production
MNWADWTIITILVISGFFGLRRGFIKETLSLVTWVAAFMVARIFGQALSVVLVDFISTPSVRIVTAFALLFVITLLMGFQYLFSPNLI